MKNKNDTHDNRHAHFMRRSTILLLIGILVTVLIITIIFFLTQPERSVTSFCSVAKEEKNSFKANTGYEKLLGSFKKLDGVAPEDIHADTSSIVKGYEAILKDPSKTTTSELGMSSAQLRVNEYITKNCPDY